MEVWKDVPGYEGLYIASNLGRVKGLKRGKILSPAPNEKGYLHIVLCKNGIMKTKKLHKIIAQTFVPNGSGLTEINHIDGNKLNNAADNLEWCSHLENMRHAVKLGLENKKKLVAQFSESGDLIAIYPSILEAEQSVGAKGIGRACKKGYRAGGYKWALV